MSSERTAAMFKDQSEEQIMNWMVENMDPEQIKGCFDQLPTSGEVEGPIDINTIRKLCAGKKYVIHKIVGDKVYFWYYRVDKGYWQYSIVNINEFPKNEGDFATSEECGNDTLVNPSFSAALDDAYVNNKFDPIEKFVPYNPGEDESEIFTTIKQQYLAAAEAAVAAEVPPAAPPAAEAPKTTTSVLEEAIQIQKSIGVMGVLSDIFIFAPILIDYINPKSFTVGYYYLVNLGNTIQFVYATLPVESLASDFQEIVDEFKSSIEIGTAGAAGSAGAGGSAGGGPTTKSVPEWKQAIKEAVKIIPDVELLQIKSIYREFPLSPNSTFFMENLFDGIQFGTYETSNNTTDLPNYVKMQYGSVTDSMFRAKLVTNSFGTQSIFLERK